MSDLKWCVLAQMPDGPILGGNDGKLYNGTEGLNSVIVTEDDNARGVPRVAVTLVDVVHQEHPGGVEIVPIRLQKAGDYHIRAGYSSSANVWFVRGEPERVPLTQEEWLMGLDTPEGRKQAEQRGEG